MKKVLVLFLSIVTLLSITSNIDLSAYAASYYEEEYNNRFDYADFIKVNSKIYGECGQGDCDYFLIQVSTKKRIEIDFSHEYSECGAWKVSVSKDARSGRWSSSIIYADDETVYWLVDEYFENREICVCIEPYNYYGYADNVEYCLNVFEVVQKPTGLKASTKSATSLALSWDKVSGVDGYQIQKKNSNNWTTEATTTNNSVTVKNLKANTNYDFRVRAYRTTNGEKYYSDWTTLKSVKIGPKNTSISSVSGVVNGFKINWDKVSDTTGYQIQYSTRSDFKNAATVYGGGTNTTSKTITGRAAGTKYYVRVRTYKTFADGSRVWGNWTSAKTVTTKVQTATAKSVVGVSKGFKVTWDKISGVTGYQVQYATRSDFKNAATVYAGNSSSTSKTITGRAKNTKYYVRVRGYKNNGGSYVYGAWSSAKAVTTK